MTKLSTSLCALFFALTACSGSVQLDSGTETGGETATETPVGTQVALVISSASAGTMQPLLGVNIGPLPSNNANADLTDEYQAVGVNCIRTHDFSGPLDMAVMYPDQSADSTLESSYNFTASDVVYASIIDGGFTPYLRLGDSYNNDAIYPDASPRAPTNQANWIQAAIHIIRHYNDPALWGRAPLQYVEIWNEPNNLIFWDGTEDEFATLFVDALQALQAAFPTLRIGGPAFGKGVGLSPSLHAMVENFMTKLVEAGVTPDFFSWHMYTNDVADYTTAINYYRELLDDYGFADVEMHVTEWNTDIHDLTDAEAEAVRVSGLSSSTLTAAWIVMQEANIAMSTFYRGPDPDIDVTISHGLFYADGTYKRSALAFSLWHLFTELDQKRTVTIPDDGAGLYALGGSSTNGNYALLVANPTTTDFDVSFSMDGTALQISGLTLKLIDNDLESIQERTLTQARFNLPAYGAALVEFEP